VDLDVCFLWLVPHRAAAPAPPAPAPAPGGLPTVAVTKDAPYFYDVDIEFRAGGQHQAVLEGVPVQISPQVLDGAVWAAECRYVLCDALGETASARQRALQAALRRELVTLSGRQTAFTEHYTILLLRLAEPTPDAFVDAHAVQLASLVRTLTKPLSPTDAASMLAARARYSGGDLTVVDWEGAVIVAPDGDFQSDIELMKIGAYQLLRLRVLDKAIEDSLRALRLGLDAARRAWLPRANRTVQAIVEQRLALVLDFEKIDQSLMLIGDWYSARVYRLIFEQVYIAEWKRTVSAKLDSLAMIDGIVTQNLAFSWRRLLDSVQFVGWLVLMVGYFIIFILDLIRK
jgi:hypothetical protein